MISSTLKMEGICSSETSVDAQRTTWRYIPEVDTLHNIRCENLKSYKYCFFLRYLRWETASPDCDVSYFFSVHRQSNAGIVPQIRP
jgi:hypothetical protein